MPWKIADVDAVLLGQGFQKTNSSNFGEQYSRKLAGTLSASAYASVKGGFWEPKTDDVEKVDFSLESKGTVYRCLSSEALKNNISTIIFELEKVSQTPKFLKCPECGTRDVHMKEPTPGGKQFKPFLSCEGMMIVGKGRDKHVACKGVSTALPALVVYS